MMVAIDKTLAACLTQLETAFERPLVPGELVSWIEEVRRAFDDLIQTWRRQVQEIHGRDYEQIVQEDPNLEHRVKQLKAVDDELIKQCDELLFRIEEFAAAAGKVEPDEQSLEAERERLAQDGINFVVAARTQEVQRRTWLMEAYQRDRGVGD